MWTTMQKLVGRKSSWKLMEDITTSINAAVETTLSSTNVSKLMVAQSVS